MAKGKARTEQEALAFIKPILPLLQRGMSMQQSCDYAGISRPTVLGYRKKFESVATEIKTAEMQMIAQATNTLYEASKTKPMYALEVLKRRSRERWGDQPQELNVEIPINVIDFSKKKRKQVTNKAEGESNEYNKQNKESIWGQETNSMRDNRELRLDMSGGEGREEGSQKDSSKEKESTNKKEEGSKEKEADQEVINQIII